jgi:hypothetical protein
MRSDLKGLRQEIREANALLCHAADYYLDCLSQLSTGRGAYGCGGGLMMEAPEDCGTGRGLEG